MAFKITFVGLAALLIAAALIQVGLAGTAKTGSATVSVSQSQLGRILVDRRGHSLYLFQKDKRGTSSCYGTCATYWPPLIASAKPHAGAGAKPSLLGRTKRRDGRWQVTYNRHPLYTFFEDMKRGQTNGEGLADFGAEWDLVSPAGAKVEKNDAESQSSGNSSSGGYGGYGGY
jgi:predicted lipoprotein with Yx(FWY)xxD motif